MTESTVNTDLYVVFTLDELLYGVRLSVAVRVLRAMEITPLPNAPSIVMGIIDLGGRIIPVVNIRRRFQLPERELELSDQLIVAMAVRRDLHEDGGRLLALAVDTVVGVREMSAQDTTSAADDHSGPGISGRGGKDRRRTHSDPRPRNLPLPRGRGSPRGDHAGEYSMNFAMSPSLLGRLSQFIAARMGLHFPQERWGDLANGLALAAREHGLKDAEEYAQWLLSAALTRREIETLASHLTVGETYFFREKRSFEILEDEVIPELIRVHQRGDQRLRIWSAGCCTGEEAYSVAMLLDKMIPNLFDWNVTILATDINPKFLESASLGIYGEWSFRGIPPGIRERHFVSLSDGKMQISRRIRHMVSFSLLNLAEDALPFPAEQHQCHGRRVVSKCSHVFHRGTCRTGR